MKYDFHLFDAVPLDVQRKFTGIFETFGMTDLARQKVAVFSDPDAVTKVDVIESDLTNGAAPNPKRDRPKPLSKKGQ